VKEVAIDSNVFIAAWLKQDQYHSDAMKFMENLRAGEYLFHISMLVPVEVCSAILRRTKSIITAYLAIREIENWVGDGFIWLYPLDGERMTKAQEIALRDELKGSDAIIAAIAEELELELITFDKEILKRYKGKKT